MPYNHVQQIDAVGILIDSLAFRIGKAVRDKDEDAIDRLNIAHSAIRLAWPELVAEALKK